MSITQYEGAGERKTVRSAESMMETIRRIGIIPFFVGPVEGYSIEDMTPAEFWFDSDDELGPWDWKVDVVNSGDIAYGKFLCGGKASFATPEWYRELMNWRRSLDKCQPEGFEAEVFSAVKEAETISPSELRKAFGVKKAKMDTALAHLMYDTLIVTGDIKRVYRGPDLHYNGWQTSSVCTPEGLFGKAVQIDGMSGKVGKFSNKTGQHAVSSNPFAADGLADDDGFAEFFGFSKGNGTMVPKPLGSPSDSYVRLVGHVRELFPNASEAQIRKVLG